MAEYAKSRINWANGIDGHNYIMRDYYTPRLQEYEEETYVEPMR